MVTEFETKEVDLPPLTEEELKDAEEFFQTKEDRGLTEDDELPI